MARILPRPTPTSQPYFDGCQAGELRLQFCAGCEQYQFYPRTLCASCGHSEPEWRTVSGRGRIASFTVVRLGISEDYPAPYTVALVDLEEGPRMMTIIVGAQANSASVGAPVQVEFEAWSEAVSMPVFKLLEESEP